MNGTFELDPEGWQRLIRSVSSGNCILVVGPEIHLHAADGPSPADELGRQLIDRFQLTAVNTDDDRFQIMQCHLDQGGRRFELEDFLVEFYRKSTSDPAIYEKLANLPFRSYLTITHDSFLQDALRRNPQKTPQFGHYHYRKKLSPDFRDPAHDRPLFYQLFGSTEQPDSLILGENDLLLFLQSVVSGTPDLAEQVQGVLRDDQTSFLFLGFGFSQWYVRILLHALLGPSRHLLKNNQRPSTVMACQGFLAHPDKRRSVAYFKSQQTFSFHQCGDGAGNLSEFIEELEKQYRDFDGGTLDPPGLLSDKSPTVFFSYRRNDGDKVTKLRETFQAAGIRVWQDVHSLRGGDNWEQALKRVIREDSDRFILLQTPDLIKSEESIVWKELVEAEDRDKGKNPANISRFIIPVILEPCEPLNCLAKYQHIDLTQPGEIDTLIKSILEDHRGRND